MNANKIPSTYVSEVIKWRRNPDVVAEVLLQANGRCAKCDSTAPFIRKSDSSAFLEVHHKVPLAKYGEDSVENAEALCPNCHREKHYGVGY